MYKSHVCMSTRINWQNCEGNSLAGKICGVVVGNDHRCVDVICYYEISQTRKSISNLVPVTVLWYKLNMRRMKKFGVDTKFNEIFIKKWLLLESLKVFMRVSFLKVFSKKSFLKLLCSPHNSRLKLPYTFIYITRNPQRWALEM